MPAACTSLSMLVLQLPPANPESASYSAAKPSSNRVSLGRTQCCIAGLTGSMRARSGFRQQASIAHGQALLLPLVSASAACHGLVYAWMAKEKLPLQGITAACKPHPTAHLSAAPYSNTEVQPACCSTWCCTFT